MVREDALPTLMENDATKHTPSFWHNKCCVAVIVRQQFTVEFALLRNIFRGLPVNCNVVNKRGAQIV
jgi:hypothetical protein